jgi:radical SAM protein with 4Fe4S-binding SPASM domain
MNTLDKLRKIYKQHPIVGKIGYPILKSYWRLKSYVLDYNYPENGKATIDLNLVKAYNKERVFGPKKRICYAAFNNMHFKMNGDVTSCSFNFDVVIGNIKQNTVKEIWNSQAAEKFREDIGNYNLDRCLSCKMVILAQNFSSYPPIKYDLFSSDNAQYPTQMSFETSDLCNFSCVMCNETLSSSIKKDKNIPLQKSIYTKSFIEDLREFIPHLQSATFIGGEPLLIKSYYDIWQMILDENPGCKIHIQTNGSILTEKFLRMLPSGQFDIGVSIDAATKEKFESIRLKSNFDEVLQNIYILNELDKQGKITLNFNFCPLTLNWNELPKVLELANELQISLKIVHVCFPMDISLMHQNISYLNYVLAELKKHPIHLKNNISKRNGEVYLDFIKNIEFNITEAKKRNSKIDEIIANAHQNCLQLLRDTVLSNNKFNHFNLLEKERLIETIIHFGTDLNPIIKEKIVARFILIFIESNEEIDGELSTNFESGLKVAKQILEQLKNLYEADDASPNF